MKTLLKRGRVVDPSQGLDEISDILIADGKISRIGKNLKSGIATAETVVIDLSGLIVTPGLIDMHTHFRDPGFEYKETIDSGSAAAAAGGFTSVACMANTNPCNDNRSVTEYMLEKAKRCGLVRIYPVGAISQDLKGKALAEYGDLKDAGIVAVSDDGKPVMNSHLMRMALEYAGSLGLPVIAHCEDADLSVGGLMHEGFVSLELGLPGIPPLSEELMISRDILLSGYTGSPLHIAHVSSQGAVELIRSAKAKGIPVTAETAPHYFTLCDEDLKTYDTNLKVSPPLRSREDVSAIREGLRDGTLDVIACDHAPHAETEKALEFEYALNGMIGLETSLALSLRLVADGVLSLSQLVEKMAANPAKILRIAQGTLLPDVSADLTVVDPNLLWKVDVRNFRSRSRNCPFDGWTMQGKAVMTMVAGEIKHNQLSIRRA